MPIPPAFYANSKNFIRYFYCQLTHNNHLLSKTLFSIILPSFAISVYELSYHIICFSIIKQASCQSSYYIIRTSTSPQLSLPLALPHEKSPAGTQPTGLPMLKANFCLFALICGGDGSHLTFWVKRETAINYYF